jgi:hypothetical protein
MRKWPTGPCPPPSDFASISPFGAPPRERRGTWYFVLAITGLVALLAMLFYFFVLLGVG